MSLSSETRIESIEAWFRAKEGNEFCAYPRDHKSVLIGDYANAKTIIYTTKIHCASQMRGLTMVESPVVMIGRYGLPLSEDLTLLDTSTSIKLIFVGDADPPDLLVFSWLREHVPILWYGVNDEFLIRHDNRKCDGIQIALSGTERETIPKLPDFCPDFRELLGEYCSSWLDDGFKIELEGAIMDRNDWSQ